MDLVVSLDDRALGEVTVVIDEAESRVISVNRHLFDLVASMVRLPPHYDEIEWWTPAELTSEGLFLTFDVSRVSLNLSFDPRIRLAQTHHMGRTYSLQEVTAQPEPYSGGVNLYATTVYERDVAVAADSAITPDYALRFEPFLNLRGWVFEGEVRYDTAEEKPLTMPAYRMVRDLPSQRLRFEAGTLRYPTIAAQGRRDILGLSLSRRFELDPDRLSRRNTADFFLNQGDNVTIFLNDQQVFADFLPPGPHRLEGLPFSPGRNELRVVAGGETQSLIIPHDADLLDAGLSDMAVAAGVLQDQTDSPAGSAFFRHGLTDMWSAGVYTHLDSGTQMAGLESTKVFAIGGFQTTFSASRTKPAWEEMSGETRWGWGTSLTYRLTLPEATIASVLISLNGRSLYYSSAGELGAENLYFGDVSSSFGIRLGKRSAVSVGARGRFAYDEDDDSTTFTISGRTQFGKSMQLFASIRSTLFSGELGEPQGTVTLTYCPQWGPNIRASVTQAIGEETTTLALSGDSTQSGSGLRWSSDATRSAAAERPYRMNDSLRYGGSRGELRFSSHVESGIPEIDPSYRFEGGVDTALLFAGTTLAIGRPVRDSFILLRKHESLNDAIVGVRRGDVWNQRTGFLGPAAVGGYNSYSFQPLYIDADRVPSEMDLGVLSHLVYPPYRGGYALTVGTGPAIYAGGIMTNQTGSPLALSPLEAHLEGGMMTLRFFTDENGVFELYGLRPGNWDLVLPRSGLYTRLIIPQNAEGYIDLGTIRMENP